MKLFVLLTLLLWGLSKSSINAQQDNAQLLHKKLQEQQENTNYLNKLKINSEIIDLSLKENDTLNIMRALLSQAFLYNVFEDTIKSNYYFDKGIALINHIPTEQIDSGIYSTIGDYYSFHVNPDNDKGLYYYHKGLALAKKTKDSVSVIDISIAIAILSAKNKGDSEMAVRYLAPVTEYLNNGHQLDSLNYVNYKAIQGVSHFQKKNYQKAIEFLNDAIKLSLKRQNFGAYADFYAFKARAFLALNEKDSVISAIRKQYQFREKMLNKKNARQSEFFYAQFEEKQIKKDLQKINELNIAYTENAKKSRVIIIFSVILILVLLLIAVFQKKNARTVKNLNNKLKSKNTDLIKATEKAKKLSRIKSNFVNMVSHELRTPLYAVTGITSILMEDSDINKKNQENLKSLKLSSEYLLQLINDILQLSKIDNDKITTQSMPFQIKPLVQNLVQSMESIKIENGNTICVEMESSLPQVLFGDKIRLQQILFNIVGNALKFTTNGAIYVRLGSIQLEGDNILLKIEIEDEGMGIPPDKQDEVFSEFSQLGRNSKSSFEGTGLGLTIVKKLVNLLKGEISLESEVGKGTKFMLTLPLKKGKASVVTKTKGSKVEPNLLSARILIVDDNKINRMVTKNVLRNENFITEDCSDGLEAVEAVKVGSFDLVLMDLNMPVMDGFKASQLIRKFNTDIPIIALTASSREELLSDIKKSGMQEIITKPYDKVEFFHAISRNLNISKAHEETIINLIETPIPTPNKRNE